MQGTPGVLLLEDHQLRDESLIECVNSLLSSGELPGLFEPQELEPMLAPLKEEMGKAGYGQHRTLYDFFVARCKQRLHIALCMDPSNLDLLHDFAGDRSTTKMLEIQCEFTDDYLIGHAKRVGLAGEQTSPQTLERLLPTIRGDMTYESDRIRDAGFEHHGVIRETAEPDENAPPIARFLDIPPEKALEIAETPRLFAD